MVRINYWLDVVERGFDELYPQSVSELSTQARELYMALAREAGDPCTPEQGAHNEWPESLAKLEAAAEGDVGSLAWWRQRWGLDPLGAGA